MPEFVQALSQFVSALSALLTAIAKPLLPWLPLVGWVVFWLFAVNWTRLRETLARGGWIGLVLLGAVAVLVWGTLSPIPGGTRDVFGLQVSNFVEKTVYVSALVTIAFLAGSVQLSGSCGACCNFSEPEPVDAGHGHDAHAGHGPDHDAHGHDGHGSGSTHVAVAAHH